MQILYDFQESQGQDNWFAGPNAPVLEIRSMIRSWRSGLIPDFVDLDIFRDGLTVSPVTFWFSANGKTAILDIWRFKTAKPSNRHVIFHSPTLPSSLDLLDILALLVRLSSPPLDPLEKRYKLAKISIYLWDRLAYLLRLSWDDCHFGSPKPLIINLTFPDFWQQRSRSNPLRVKNGVAD